MSEGEGPFPLVIHSFVGTILLLQVVHSMCIFCKMSTSTMTLFILLDGEEGGDGESCLSFERRRECGSSDSSEEEEEEKSTSKDYFVLKKDPQIKL